MTLNSQQVRDAWASWRCNPAAYARVAFPGHNRVWNLQVADAAVPAWTAFAAVMTYEGYLFLEGAGGTYNCRDIGGGDCTEAHSDDCSIHAYAQALDLNPSKNPYGKPLRHNYPPGFVSAIKAIRINGKQAFVWGGDWNTPDAMHWQIAVAPSDFGVTQPPNQGDDEVKEVVEGIQRSLTAAGYDPGTIDGVWGPRTEGAHAAMTEDAAKTGGGGLDFGDVVRLSTP